MNGGRKEKSSLESPPSLSKGRISKKKCQRERRKCKEEGKFAVCSVSPPGCMVGGPIERGFCFIDPTMHLYSS